jgi:hypothetical protein
MGMYEMYGVPYWQEGNSCQGAKTNPAAALRNEMEMHKKNQMFTGAAPSGIEPKVISKLNYKPLN